MRAMHKRLYPRRGFTLLELMVVLFILATLAGVVTVVVVKRVEQAKHVKAVADIESFKNALATFYLHNGRYPYTEEGLNALRVKPQSEELPNWDGPYIEKAVSPDPWKQDYHYLTPGDHNPDSFDLYSLGKDGLEGGTGSDADIVNWDE